MNRVAFYGGLIVLLVGFLVWIVRPNQAQGKTQIEFFGAKFSFDTPAFGAMVIGLALMLYSPRFPEYFAPSPGPSERDAIQHLMDSICNRGVLQNDYSWEVPSAVNASVAEIGNELGNALGRLGTDSAARQPLQNMQRASRMLLQDPTVFPDGPGGHPRPISGPLRDAIHKFRAAFSQNTTQLVQVYALKGNCELSAGLETVPSNSGVAEPRN
jgi:hypothetical protein